ncbi:hypothetical protein NS2R_22020 [Pseudomonas oryzihabitans]|nr:hypothetical protein NS2R_22020 [Pseudomonas psychrotolerans]
MGIELDVLVGHPEHDLLFVATQAARAAGLKDAAKSVSQHRKTKSGTGLGLSLAQLMENSSISVPDDEHGRRLRTTTAIMTEPELYQMLVRSHAPQTEAFRKWVTEEVLPTIRKTGSYNAADSTNPIAQSVMDELKAVRGELADLKAMIAEMAQRPAQQVLALPAPVSPYEASHL